MSIKKPAFLLLLVVCLASCFVLVYHPKPLESRLAKHKKDIEQTDFSKIRTDGAYYDTVTNYRFIFSPTGVVTEKYVASENHRPRSLNDKDYEVKCVFYIHGNILYLEEFNGYSGYFIKEFQISDDRLKIDYHALKGRAIIYDEKYLFKTLKK